ncbi:MAG TPA: glycosyltransferase family 2 protein [Actinomycetota bacterium]|nr:glycosyltransferase family 2 protein [Actinomycetota bacterium]
MSEPAFTPEASETTQAAERPIDVLMPAHNEGSSIGVTIREFHEVASERLGIAVRFVVAEDGSTDDTCDVIRSVGEDLPVELLSFPERKGYSKAVVDGFRATSGDVVCFIDSDGQLDPADLPRLLRRLEGRDLVVGYRVHRNDTMLRRAMSGAFKALYRMLFPVRLRDPSCPYLVIRRDALERVLEGSPGILKQGFWWEFNARAAAHRLDVAEVPVRHRRRTAGETQVYRLEKIPRIAYEHILGLFALRRELQRLASA